MTDQNGEERDKDRHRMFRALFSVEKEDWKAFKAQAGDGNAPTVLRQFVRWYIGRPDAKMPRRPKAAE